MNYVLALGLAGAIAVSGVALAQESGQTADSTGCGIGTNLFEGQSGVGPQIMAVTTNGLLTNTFSVTSGTAGCNSDGVVALPTDVRVIVASSLDGLARDVARGEGETLESLADAMTIDEGDKLLFRTELQGNFDRIFPADNVSGDEVWAHIHAVMTENETLRRYVSA
jgi:hypothetical protein